MLDKSVPYFNILMKRPADIEILDYELPEGFKFVMYRPGDEVEWAEIERTVLEYPTRTDAMVKFRSKFIIFKEELERRLVFVESPEGEKIGTCMIWWEYSSGRRDPWVNYVALKPEYQGRGISNAMISYILKLSEKIEGKRDIYLHTQTPSHRAVKLYKKFGFYITREPNLYKYPNDEYEQAEAVLEEVYKTYPKGR